MITVKLEDMKYKKEPVLILKNNKREAYIISPEVFDTLIALVPEEERYLFCGEGIQSILKGLEQAENGEIVKLEEIAK